MALVRCALIHSPLTSAAVWGDVPELLRDAGLMVAVTEVLDDDVPPYATRFVARVALQLAEEYSTERIVLIGHDDAGPLLPQIGFARAAAGAPVGGYVFLDAALPRNERTSNRLDLMRLTNESATDTLETQLMSGLSVPHWRESELTNDLPNLQERAILLAGLRPRALDYYTEPLPLTEDWPDARCAYLQMTMAYVGAADTASRRGWNVERNLLHHFAMLSHPAEIADSLRRLVEDL